MTSKANTAQAQRHKDKNQKKKILVLVFTLGLCLLLGRSYSEKRFNSCAFAVCVAGENSALPGHVIC